MLLVALLLLSWQRVGSADVGSFVDLWGHEVEWGRADDGWDEDKRGSLKDIDAQNKIQPTWVT